MQQVLIYGDSLSWGIVPGSRKRFSFAQRWPGIAELALRESGLDVRIIEDCLNGRRTVWDDPYKPGRRGIDGLAQRIEVNAPLALVVVCLGTNDFQSMHPHNAWHCAQGIAALIAAIRQAPVEPGMPVPPVLVVAPPAIQRARGEIAPKFHGAQDKAVGLTEAIRAMAGENGCHFFDAGTVTTTSRVDGVHLDEDQHLALGRALAGPIQALLT